MHFYKTTLHTTSLAGVTSALLLALCTDFRVFEQVQILRDHRVKSLRILVLARNNGS